MTRDGLPTGAVTFLFSDIEGSTRLLDELGVDAYSAALAEHRQVMRDAFARHGGVEVDTQGDAFFVAFADAKSALCAAAEAQQALAAGPVRTRIGLHTGLPRVDRDGYVGPDVHLGARIAAAGHGGQVLLSSQTRELIDDTLIDLGEHRLKDFSRPVWLFQLGDERFPPLRTLSNTNLPRPASSFVGREREVADIGRLVNNGVRLLTLTGPGGSGKSRLAIESAAQLVPDDAGRTDRRPVPGPVVPPRLRQPPGRRRQRGRGCAGLGCDRDGRPRKRAVLCRVSIRLRRKGGGCTPQIGRRGIEHIWSEGALMSLEEAVRYVLG